MRLSEQEIQIIKAAVCKYDSEARIFLFGSRVDDNKRGGDIDLYIQSEKLQQKDAYGIKELIWDDIGEQKIDIVIHRYGDTPFLKIALKECIEL